MSILKNLIFLVAALWSGSALAVPIMHVHDNSGILGTVDVATGNVSVIGPMGRTMTDIAFDPMGNLYGIDFDNLYSINATTGASSLIGGHSVPGGNALVFGNDGTLYSAGNSSTNLYTLNVATGGTTDLGNQGFNSAGDLAFNGGDLYLATGSNQLHRIDLTDLSNSMTVGSFGVSGVFGLATGDNGSLYAVAGTNIYDVDLLTGLAMNPVSFASQGLGTAFGESFITEAGGGTPVTPPTTDIPAPASLWLLGIGLVVLGLRRSRPVTKALF